MTTAAHDDPHRILVVGRSPGVLEDTLAILRGKGYAANATNQFDSVLDDYDVADLEILVFGGMVPADTKQHLREQISARNPRVTFVQGLAGIAGLIAAQVQGVIASDEPDRSCVVYDADERSVQLTISEPTHVMVEAWWATSFTPPEPASTSLLLVDADLDAGLHTIALPDQVPAEASFLTVAAGSAVHTLTVGPIPESVMRLVPKGGAAPAPGDGLSPVRALTTHL
jgi:hypothetical protein